MIVKAYGRVTVNIPDGAEEHPTTTWIEDVAEARWKPVTDEELMRDDDPPVPREFLVPSVIDGVTIQLDCAMRDGERRTFILLRDQGFLMNDAGVTIDRL